MKLVDRGDGCATISGSCCSSIRAPPICSTATSAPCSARQRSERNALPRSSMNWASRSLFDHLAGVLDHADARMRDAVRALPDGVYLGEDHTDNDCFEKLDVAVRVAMTSMAIPLTLDFSGSDPQMRGFKNSSLANTYSAAYLALSSFFDTSIPRNEGTYRCVEIIAPEGSIVNARPPAPMTMNTVFVAHEIVHAVWRALAKAVPERACAGWAKTTHGHITARIPWRLGWVMYQWHAMGTPGATAERDGFPQMGHLISLGGLDLPNLEFHEQLFPVRYQPLGASHRCSRARSEAWRHGRALRGRRPGARTWSFRAEGLDTHLALASRRRHWRGRPATDSTHR